MEAWADGMNEGLKYCMLNFEEAVDIFVSEVPEVKMSSTGRKHTRYGAGLFLAALLTPEIRDHGLGLGRHASLNQQTDLVMKYAVAAEQRTARRRDHLQQRHGGKGEAHSGGVGDRAQDRQPNLLPISASSSEAAPAAQ